MVDFPQSKQRENASKSEKKKTVQPSFQKWPDRMGKHLAYHVNPINKLIHALCIPLELFGVLNLFSILANPLWLAIVLSPVFLCCDFIIGGSFVTALLLMAYYLAAQAPLLCGLVCFVGGFLVPNQSRSFVRRARTWRYRTQSSRIQGHQESFPAFADFFLSLGRTVFLGWLSKWTTQGRRRGRSFELRYISRYHIPHDTTIYDIQ